MKKSLLVFLMPIIILIGGLWGSYAQAQGTSVDIGTAQTSSNILPFNTYYRYSYSQMMYYKSEVGDAGYIGAISFYKDGAAGRTVQELTIWMGHTSDSIMTMSSWVPADSLKQVFHATNFEIPTISGEMMIALDSSFHYDGVHHLAIVISRKDNGSDGDIKFRYTPKSYSCLYRRSNTESVYADHPGIYPGQTGLSRPNITLIKNNVDSFCLPVANLAVTSVTENSINVAWAQSANSQGFEVAILDTVEDGSNLNSVTPVTITDNSYRFVSLSANHVYKIGVRKICGEGVYSSWNTLLARTTTIPATLPFTCDFESETARNMWVLENGDLTNRWVIDTGIVHGEELQYGLYISDDTTLAKAYKYNTSAMATVFATCLLQFGEVGEYNIKYDWKANGEGNVDFMRVMLVPASSASWMIPGGNLPSGLTYNTLPSGAIAIDGGEKLNQSLEWNTYKNVVEISETGNYYLVYMWRNNANKGSNPPAAVDNILVEHATCLGVDSVVVTNINPTNVTINGFSTSGNNFVLYYRPWEGDSYDSINITSPYVLNGLTPSTYYKGELRSSCGADGNSFSTTEFQFGTECESATLPWAFGAEATFLQKRDEKGFYPYCWDIVNGSGEHSYWSYKNSASDVHSGSKSIYFQGSYSASTKHDDWLILPAMTFTGQEEISLWVRTTTTSTGSNNHGRFAIYASNESATGMGDTAHYDLLTITGNSIVDNRVDFVGKEWQKVTVKLPVTLVGNHNLAFVVKDVNSYMFCVDDIYIYTPTGCAIPDSIQVKSIASTSANISWASEASSFKVYYGEPGFDVQTATAQTVSTKSVDLAGLEPNKTYEVRIVAVCSADEVSPWSYPVIVKTTCSPLAIESLPLSEDFSDNVADDEAMLDDCWIKGTNSSTNYPYVKVVTTGDEEDKVLYFNSSASNYSYVALPAMEEEFANLMLTCRVRRHTSANFNSALSLGLMSNPYDISTFTPYDTLAPEEVGQWSDFQLTLSEFSSEHGQYLAFLLPAGRTGYSYLDDIQISQRGECDSPYDPVVNTITPTTAVVSWSDTSANNWVVYYGAPGFNIDTVSNPVTAADTHAVEIVGLSPQTVYEFVVVANCGSNNNSLPTMPVQFTTACSPVSTLPYIENFESYASGESESISPCWYTHAIGTAKTYPYPDTKAAINGARGLYLRAYETSSEKYNSYAVLPMFEESISNLKIKFNMKNDIGTGAYTAYFSKVAVGIMSNPNDITTFDTIEIIDMSRLKNKTVEMHEIAFNAYVGVGKYIALLALDVNRTDHNSADNKIYIDDVEVNLIPTCHRPTHVVSTMTTTTADLSWEGNATSYEVMYSQHEDMSDSTVLVASTNQIQLTGLSNYTYYYVNIRGVCSATDKSEWLIYPICIRTAIDCGDGYQSFVDTIGDGVYKNNYYAVNGHSSQKDACNWSIFTAEEMAESGLVGNANMIRSISLHVGNAGAPLPLRIYMAETPKSIFTTSMQDTIPVSQMTLVCDSLIQFKADSWNEIMLQTPFRYSDTMSLMIAFARDSVISSSTYFYYTTCDEERTVQKYTYVSSGSRSIYRRKYRANMAFNICGDVPNCIRPRNIAISNVTSTTVDLTWVGTASSYQIIPSMGLLNMSAISSDDIITVTGNSTTLQNLLPSTTYHIYMRSICGTDTSIWASPIVISTPCSPIDLPYSENFDSYLAGTTSTEGQIINSCWVKGTNNSSQYPYLTTQYASSPNNSLRFFATPSYYCYVSLPMFTEPINNTIMTFQLMRASSHYGSEKHGTLHVGIMEDPHDITTFQRVATVQPNDFDVWQHFEIPFNTYTGTGRYIAIMMPDSINSYAYLDNIEVFATPTCPAPINVTVPTGTITTTSAVVQWTDRAISPANGYEIEYGEKGFELGTGTRIQTTSNPTTLNNLAVGSCYDVYVRALCSDTDKGRWSYAVSFNTDCGPVSLPVTYNFDNFQAVSTVIPHCFNRYNDASGERNQNYPNINDGLINAHSGNQFVYFYMNAFASYAMNSAIIFPEVNVVQSPMAGNQMTFWGKRGSSPSKVFIGVMTNPSDYNTLTIVDSVILDGVYTEYTVSLAGYTGTGAYPVIAAKRTDVTQYIYIDDVTIEEIPACARAYNLHAVSATDTSATVAWTDTIASTQWILDYYQANETTVYTETVTTNPYTITGLAPHTKYFFNVRPICSDNDTSSNTLHDVAFWTTQVPASLPYQYNFEEADEWNNWQTSSNCNINWYRGSAVAGEGTNAMYISMDNGETRSSSWLQTVNATAYRDIDFGADTSSFVMTFKANAGGTPHRNFDGIAVMLVDPTVEVNSSDVELNTPWGDVEAIALDTVRLDTTWGTYTVYLERIASVQRIAFYWYNKNSGKNYEFVNAAGAIDDIQIKEQTCLRPYNLHVTDIESSSVTLNWGGSASSYEVSYGKVDDSIVVNQIVNSNSFGITDLISNTEYQFQVRSLCPNNDTSFWSDVKYFQTICTRYRASDTIREDFSNIPSASYNEVGEIPSCWERYSNGANGVKPHVIGSGSYWYAHNNQSLVMTAGNSATYGENAIVRLPYTIEPVNSLVLSFWMCTESPQNGVLEVGYLTGNNLATDFVAVKAIQASDATKNGGLGNQNDTIGLYDTVSFDSVPANAQAVAFRWSYNTSYYSVCIDDVVLYSNITCFAPSDINTVIDHESVDLTWDDVAENYQILYKETTSTVWSDTINVDTCHYTLDNLLPETNYVLQLRSLCGEADGNSMWAEVEFTTNEARCIKPIVTVDDITGDGATFTWNKGDKFVGSEVHVFNNIFDTIVAVADTNLVMTSLVQATTFNVAVRVQCATTVYSDWSDTVEFTTLDCLPVTGVAVNNITKNSAVITWTAGADETSWEINYGEEGFAQGEGIFKVVDATTYTLTELVPETAYDVYVRAICGESFYSIWSTPVVQFTTLADEQEGIDGVEGNYNFAIYPNPANNSTTLSLTGVEGKVAISVVDINGRMVANETIECGVDCEKRIDVTNLSQGTYFVRVLGDNVNSVRKLIVR